MKRLNITFVYLFIIMLTASFFVETAWSEAPAPQAAGRQYKPGDTQELNFWGVPTTFRWCPPGETLIPPADPIEANVSDWKSSAIEKGFWIMETEMTVELYQKLTEKGRLRTLDKINEDCKDDKQKNDLKESKQPLRAITKDDIPKIEQAVQNAYSGNTSESLLDFKFQVPTLIQWQYACRGVSDVEEAKKYLHFAKIPIATKDANFKEYFEGRVKSAKDERAKKLGEESLYICCDADIDFLELTISKYWKSIWIHITKDKEPKEEFSQDQIVKIFNWGIINKKTLKDHKVSIWDDPNGFISPSNLERTLTKTMDFYAQLYLFEKKTDNNERCINSLGFREVKDKVERPNAWGIYSMQTNAREVAKDSEGNYRLVGGAIDTKTDADKNWKEMFVWGNDDFPDKVSEKLPGIRLIMTLDQLKKEWLFIVAKHIDELSNDKEKFKQQIQTDMEALKISLSPEEVQQKTSLIKALMWARGQEDSKELREDISKNGDNDLKEFAELSFSIIGP